MDNSDFIERIAIALEEQNKTLKKIHVALNGISGNLIQHTHTIKESLENIEGDIENCHSDLKNLDITLGSSLVGSVEDLRKDLPEDNSRELVQKLVFIAYGVGNIVEKLENISDRLNEIDGTLISS